LRFFALAFYVDVKALNLLIQCGKRYAQNFGGVGLAPVEALEMFDDGAALEIRHDLEERGVGG
jgi:hypothetical protein